MIAPDAACRLDILCRRFGLPLNQHKPEPRYVETNRDHVCGESYVDRVVGEAKESFKTFLGSRDVVRRYARGQFDRRRHFPVGEWLIGWSETPPLSAVTADAVAHFVFDDAPRSAQFT